MLAALVVVSLILLTAAFGSAGGGTSGGVAGPLVDGASTIAKPVRDLINWFGDTADATDENKKLRKENAELRRQTARLASAGAENDRLRKQLGLSNRLQLQSRYGAVGADVIAQSPTAWASTLRIDKGTGDGIEKNDPVVAADDDGGGLVGFVTAVQAGSAIVSLLPDQSVKVGARLQGGKDFGVLQGAGAGTMTDLELLFIPAATDIPDGTLVVTSGTAPNAGDLDSKSPPDLPIGRITRVAGRGGDDQVAHLRPLVDLRSLETVQVLTRSVAGTRSP